MAYNFVRPININTCCHRKFIHQRTIVSCPTIVFRRQLLFSFKYPVFPKQGRWPLHNNCKCLGVRKVSFLLTRGEYLHNNDHCIVAEGHQDENETIVHLGSKISNKVQKLCYFKILHIESWRWTSIFSTEKIISPLRMCQEKHNSQTYGIWWDITIWAQNYHLRNILFHFSYGMHQFNWTFPLKQGNRTVNKS